MRLAFFVSAVMAAGLASGCQTHHLERCPVPCGEEQHAAFVACVADGSSECAAGNRRCCALAQGCVGQLEDQNVVSNRVCEDVPRSQCAPPCTEMDQQVFLGCVRGGGPVCEPGDARCCAGAIGCLGELVHDGASYVVRAEECCVTREDCAPTEVCDPSFWRCVPPTPVAVCGDEIAEAPEECDDGNDITDPCEYGEMSCEVCTSDCELGPGITSYCGDGVVDSVAGEQCEPSVTSGCDPMCMLVPLARCDDRLLNGDETDVDCGGSCPPCIPGESCVRDADCTTTSTDCSPGARCDSARRVCIEVPCDDFDVCTIDTCFATGGCTNVLIDMDRDGHGPSALGCGGDCDDTNPYHSPDFSYDGCAAGDEDCDGRLDEDC